MKPQTRLALRELNRRFYDERADAFSASRDHPWPGWTRLLSHVAEPSKARTATRAFAVLDAGCGNGRFLAFLADTWRERFAYAGCDSSAALLAIASKQAPPHVEVELRECDLCAQEAGRVFADRSFDLVAVFGVLHHVPDADERRGLVAALADRVAPGGVLALTFWRFGRRERFARRVLRWADYNSTADRAIDEADLEAGDMLLRFGDTPGPPRYCHLADDREIDALVAEVSAGDRFALVDRYCADGKSGDLNEYVVLRRADAVAREGGDS
jgi:SAM-dependent methyltransferase